MNLIEKAKTVLSSPTMLTYWLRWNLRYFGFTAKLALPLGGKVKGFRNFSEYWGAKNGIPPASEIAYFMKYAGKSGVMIDVGANLGILALTLTKCRPHLLVHAFEPSPETYDILTANLRANNANSINSHQLAMGKSSGLAMFRNDQRSPPTNRLIEKDQIDFDNLIQVKVMTLDEFLTENDICEVAFLKVDVEGYEAEVLKGSRKLFQKLQCKAALLELCPRNLTQVGSSIEELLAVVSELGYTLYFLHENGSLGDKINLENASVVLSENVAMIPTR